MFKPIQNAKFYSFYNMPKHEMFFGSYKQIVQKVTDEGFETYTFKKGLDLGVIDIYFHINLDIIHKGRIFSIFTKKDFEVFDGKNINEFFNLNLTIDPITNYYPQITDFQFEVLVATLK